jgi:hypothetical protein
MTLHIFVTKFINNSEKFNFKTKLTFSINLMLSSMISLINRYTILANVSQNSAVGIATGYGQDN